MWYPSTFLYSNKVESTIHRLRRSPFLSRKEHRFSCFPLISFRMLALCKKRTFCFIPVICKDCTILSREWHNHSCGLMVCFKAGDWALCTILGYGLPERETCCILPVNQLSRAYFLTKWKKCNIVSLFLQIHIVESTIHHSLMRTVHPFFQERSCILHFPFWRNFSILALCKKKIFRFTPSRIP